MQDPTAPTRIRIAASGSHCLLCSAFCGRKVGVGCEYEKSSVRNSR